MILRSGIKVAEWLGALVAGLALVAGFGFWLLADGPLSLDWLAPYVASVFEQAEPGLTAHIDHTLVRLGEGPRLEIIAHGLHLKHGEGEAELTLPDVSLSLSPEALVFGIVAPTRISLLQPKLHLLRDADGSFHLGLGGEQPGENDWAESLLLHLAQPPDRQGSFGYLTRIEARDATLTVDDRTLDVTWAAKQVDATLFRRLDGISGDLALTVERGGQTAELHGDFHYDPTPRKLIVSVSFDDLRPALFAAAAPALKPLAMFDLPLGGQVSATLNMDTLRLADFWSEVELGEGRIVNARLANGALKVAHGKMRAVYDPLTNRLDLEQLTVELDRAGGPTLNLSATVPNFEMLAQSPMDFSAHLQVHDLVAADIGLLWPENVSVHGREWILQHLEQGTLTGSEVTIAGKINPNADSGAAVTVDSVNGTVAYRDVTVAYFHPLTPIHGIEGTGTFDRTRFDLFPTTGIARDVRLSGGAIHLTKLETEDEEAAVDVNFKGQLTEILTELDSKPLRYAHALDIDPSHSGGTAEGHLHFHLPMKKALRFAQVDYAAKAKLDDVEIGHVFFNRDLAAGDLRLDLDRGGLRIVGTAKLAGEPVALDWSENFANDPVRTRYRVAGTFDDAARRRLGIDLMPSLVSGPVKIDLAFAKQRNGFADSTIKLDLGAAELQVAKLGWKKAAGVPASAQFVIRAHDGEATLIDNLRIEGGGLDAQLNLALTGNGIDAGIDHAQIVKLTTGKTDVTGTIMRRKEGGWLVQLRGKSLDIAPLMDELQHGPSGATEPPLLIETDLDRMYLAPDRLARAVHARLYSDGVHWQSASIDATPADGGKFTFRFGAAEGDRNVRLSTNDFGALLRLLDITSKVQGGRLTVTGQVEDQGGVRVLRGKLDGNDYRVVEAPGFARLLSLASFTGPAALMSGQGIPFSRLQSDFVLNTNTLELHNARAFGEAIGINASGRFNYRANTLDVGGTLVPAYMLNSLVGNIPVFGDLLVGGKGEGIFGANFRIAGAAAEPGISVNPLSAFAPGFLRRLFFFDAWAPNPSPATTNTANVPNGGG